jgi:hypothetical protein
MISQYLYHMLIAGQIYRVVSQSVIFRKVDLVNGLDWCHKTSSGSHPVRTAGLMSQGYFRFADNSLQA